MMMMMMIMGLRQVGWWRWCWWLWISLRSSLERQNIFIKSFYWCSWEAKKTGLSSCRKWTKEITEKAVDIYPSFSLMIKWFSRLSICKKYNDKLTMKETTKHYEVFNTYLLKLSTTMNRNYSAMFNYIPIYSDQPTQQSSRPLLLLLHSPLFSI